MKGNMPLLSPSTERTGGHTRGGGGGMDWESRTDIGTPPCASIQLRGGCWSSAAEAEVYSWGEAAAAQLELSSVLCDDLEWRDGGGGREVLEGRDR